MKLRSLAKEVGASGIYYIAYCESWDLVSLAAKHGLASVTTFHFVIFDEIGDMSLAI